LFSRLGFGLFWSAHWKIGSDRLIYSLCFENYPGNLYTVEKQHPILCLPFFGNNIPTAKFYLFILPMRFKSAGALHIFEGKFQIYVWNKFWDRLLNVSLNFSERVNFYFHRKFGLHK
jgi:hypothetical protein